MKCSLVVIITLLVLPISIMSTNDTEEKAIIAPSPLIALLALAGEHNEALINIAKNAEPFRIQFLRKKYEILFKQHVENQKNS